MSTLTRMATAAHPAPIPDLGEYSAFLRAKVAPMQTYGFEVTAAEINPLVKPHQRDAIIWAVGGGRRALFEAFGLGKSIQQIEILRLCQKHTRTVEDPLGEPVLELIPLGVRSEFMRDGMLDTDEWRDRARELGLDHAEIVREFGVWFRFIRTNDEMDAALAEGCRFFLSNYESVRDGRLDPNRFVAVSLDEADCLRGFGGTKTFRQAMAQMAGDDRERGVKSEGIRFRFVATATPDPNEYIELLAYSAFLGIIDVSAGKTRFFKRDSTKADKLTLHAHKVEEWWLWISTWALFVQKPSDLGYPDEGYDLPPLQVILHEVSVTHDQTGTEKSGQKLLFREATHGVSDASREKRRTMAERVQKMADIIADAPGEHFLLWHDLEDERRAIEAAVPGCVSVYGSQDLDAREQHIIDFSDGKFPYLAGKPVMLGSGVNFQRHCHRAIYVGIGFKFKDWVQSVHRVYRFLQKREVTIHLIYAESERSILRILMEKWERHKEQVARMSEIIQKYGLSAQAMASEMQRAMGVDRIETTGRLGTYRLVNDDTIRETKRMAEESPGSVHQIVTSIPFETQYEYSPNFADLGHSDNCDHFWQQMDFLSPSLFRVLSPGRLMAIHVKDRNVPGGINGLGFQTVNPFHAQAIGHYLAHGFAYMGMITVTTDVVRENNQTYRLSYTEMCKDSTKMGVGMPEYVLLFRRPPSDSTNSYADYPVAKTKPQVTDKNGHAVAYDPKHPIIPGTGHSLAWWQTVAHGYWRSNGNRPLGPEDFEGLDHNIMYRLFRDYHLANLYEFEAHVKIGEKLEMQGKLPTDFMLLQPPSNNEAVWTDVTRMQTLNGAQYAKGREMHICPIQFQIVERLIDRYSAPGETIYDPFAGIGSVPMTAVKMGRIGVGCELSHRYWLDSIIYCEAAEQEIALPSLFDLLEAEHEATTAREVEAVPA